MPITPRSAPFAWLHWQGSNHVQYKSRLSRRKPCCRIDQSQTGLGAGIPIRNLPLYSYDHDPDFPEVARDFKQAIAKSDAVLFVTPEYNRSIPGGLKNAIDWASRPVGTNAFTHKPSAAIGTSPGAISTALAQQHLHSVLSACNSPQMHAPEAYIHFSPGLFDDEGRVNVTSTEIFLRQFLVAFQAHIVGVLTEQPLASDAAN
jgi:chromate reductase, NAD(P)H dehydrogenase (quinone)